MRLSAEGKGFRVYDDVLGAEDFERLWLYIQRCQYNWIHAQGWRKAWRLTDGMPLVGQVCFSDEATARALGPTNAPPNAPVPRELCYPTGRHIDLLMRAIDAHADDWSALIGKHGEQWLGFTAKPYLYPLGAGLSWHEDVNTFYGAFTYYAHPEWNVQWGGELMVCGEGVAQAGGGKGGSGRGPGRGIYAADLAARAGQHLDNSLENSRLLDEGAGQFVFPRPNRLVVLQPGVPHAVHPVTAAAGDHARASVAGFFIATPQELQRQTQAQRALAAQSV